MQTRLPNEVREYLKSVKLIYGKSYPTIIRDSLVMSKEWLELKYKHEKDTLGVKK